MQCSPLLDAALVDGAIPVHLAAGEYADVAVTVKNLGTSAWTRTGNIVLAAQSSNQITWSNFRDGGNSTSPINQTAYLASTDSIGVEKTKTFIFRIQAPSTTGSYTMSARMKTDGGAEFGDIYTWTVNVVPALNSELVASNLSTTMVVNSTQSVKIEVKNKGTTNWFNSGYYRLASTASNQFAFSGFYPNGGYSNSITDQRVFIKPGYPTVISMYDDQNPDTRENNMNIYQTARQGASFDYKFDVANGTYLLELSVAEFQKTSDFQRKYSINIEGRTYVQDFDPYVQLLGMYKGKDIKYEVPVSDGQLNLQFSASVDQALINAIRVKRIK